MLPFVGSKMSTLSNPVILPFLDDAAVRRYGLTSSRVLYGIWHQYDWSLQSGRPPVPNQKWFPLCRAREEGRCMCLTQKEAFCDKPGRFGDTLCAEPERRPSMPSLRGNPVPRLSRVSVPSGLPAGFAFPRKSRISSDRIPTLRKLLYGLNLPAKRDQIESLHNQ